MVHGFSLENAEIYDRRDRARGSSSLERYYHLTKILDPDFAETSKIQKNYILNNCSIEAQREHYNSKKSYKK